MRTYLDAPAGWTCREFIQGAKLFIVYRTGEPSSDGIGFIANLDADGEDRWFYARITVANMPHWLGPGYSEPGPAIAALIRQATDQEVTQ